MQQYTRGQIVNLYANFLTLEGKEATTITNQKITIRHIDSGGTLVTDINEVTMTLAIETLYFFKWTVPIDADLGNYTVEYQAIIDGEDGEANETIQIVEFIQEPAEICSTSYTSVDNVAKYLGVDVSNIEPIWLEWASRYIDFYTCIKFCETIVTEKYDITEHNQEILMLDHYPILEVTELLDDGDPVDLNDFLIYEEEGFIKFADEFSGTNINLLQPGPFSFGRQKVQVTYKYGFTSTPKEIEWVATVLASSIAHESLVQSGTISSGEITEEQIGEYRRKRSTESSTTDFSNTVEDSKVVADRLKHDIFSAKNILEMYRDKKMRSV